VQCVIYTRFTSPFWSFGTIRGYEIGAVKARIIKCFRIIWEAYEQGGGISIDDVASILTMDPSTIKDYIKELEELGLFVPTRGRLKDIGRVPSHKVRICTLLAQGYTYTEISFMTNHCPQSRDRYLDTLECSLTPSQVG